MRGGIGLARPAFTERRCRQLEEAYGWRRFGGTLNLRVVADPERLVHKLGAPDLETEHETAIGPLRWWRVTAAVSLVDVSALVVCGVRSRAPYIEVVAPVRLRKFVTNGDLLTVKRAL